MRTDLEGMDSPSRQTDRFDTEKQSTNPRKQRKVFYFPMSLPRQFPLPQEIYAAPEETIYSVAKYISLLNATIKGFVANFAREVMKGQLPLASGGD